MGNVGWKSLNFAKWKKETVERPLATVPDLRAEVVSGFFYKSNLWDYLLTFNGAICYVLSIKRVRRNRLSISRAFRNQNIDYKKTTKNLAIVLLTAGSASAATISWDPVVVNTTASDIITAGALHYSSNSAGSTDQTINGVTFVAEAGPLPSNANGTFYTTGGGVNTTGDLALDTLLNSHSYAPGGGSFDITGLTVGDSYQIQIIAVGDTRGCCLDRNQQFGGGTGISDDLRRGDPSSVVGSFIADGPFQTINVLVGSGVSSDPGISGVQVRNVSIPEPGTALLSFAGLLGLALRRRR